MAANKSIFKNRFSLNYKNISIEENFEKLRQDKISKRNLVFLSTGLILSITETILQLAFKDKLLASSINWYYDCLYTSIAISLICIINLILASLVKNYKFQRYSAFLSYVLLTVPFLICRIYLINILQDGTKISNAIIALFLTEMIARFMCYYANILTFFEGFLANLLCIIVFIIFWSLVFGSSINEEFIIGYLLIMIFLNVFAYFYDCEIKNTFYVNYQLDKKKKLDRNIMNNMNSGFICIKDKKIDFVNSSMFQLMKSNMRISKIFGTCELLSDISKDQKENNLLRIPGIKLEKTNEEILSIIRGDEQVCTKIMDVVFNDIKGDMRESDQKGLLHNTENSRLKSNINLSNSSYNLINQFSTSDYLAEFQSNYLNKNLSENYTTLGYKNLEVDSVCEGVRATELISLEIVGRFYKSCEHNESEIFEFIFKDITQVRNLEKKNAEFNSKFLLLSKFAHKFEYPIISIRELVNKLLNGLEINKETDIKINIEDNAIKIKNSMNSLMHESLSSIKALSDYLLLRVKDLDFFSKNKIGGSDFSKELNDVDLKEFLECCEEISNGLLKLNNKQSRVAFVMNKGENLPEKILIDKTKLKQILINLLSNAIKHTDKGQVTLGVDIQTEGVLRFLVEDTGSGTTNDSTSNSLIPFIKSKSSNNKIGAGLGLTIVSNLSHQLGSKISFDSRLGEGSKFWLDLNYTESEHIEQEENKDFISHIIEEEKDLPKIEINDIELSQVNLNETNLKKNKMSPSAQSRSSQITLKKMMPLSHPMLRENPSARIVNSNVNFISNKNIEAVDTQFGKSIISDLNLSTEYFMDLDHTLHNYIVADDEKFTRKAVIRLLTHAARNLNKNVKFIESEDGIETLFIIYQSVVKGVKISGVISAETMRLMTGSKSAQLMKAIDKNSISTIPFFITTAQDNRDSIQKLHHVDGVYKKPIKLHDAENILSSRV